MILGQLRIGARQAKNAPLTIVKVYDVKKYSSLCIVYWWKPDLAITSLQHGFIGDQDLHCHDPKFLGWHSISYETNMWAILNWPSNTFRFQYPKEEITCSKPELKVNF